MKSLKNYPRLMSFTQTILQQEFQNRKLRNKRYSLRAFARDLGISPGRLSELFSGRRIITKALAHKLSGNLNLDDEILHKWLNQISEDKVRGKTGLEYEQVESGHLEILADVDCFHFLSLVKTKNFKLDEDWISSRLGISKQKIKSLIEKLCTIGYLEQTKGKLLVKKPKVQTTTDIPQPLIRNSHRSFIKLADESLESVPLEHRDVSSICMNLDVSILPKAKKKIEKFRKEMAQFVSKGKTNEVYRLNIQFFPVTKLKF